MRAQTFIVLVACALTAMVLAVHCVETQDQKCRQIAKSLGLEQGLIDRVPRFLLYGPPDRQQEDCMTACDYHGMTLGFAYFGNQACCCGIPV